MQMKFLRSSFKYPVVFIKWILIAAIVGGISGVIGSMFHSSLEFVTEFRIAHSWIIWLLPLSGLIIVWMYRFFHVDGRRGTNQIIDAVHQGETVPLAIAPLIFMGTAITHLFGGSAGREGAALQIGGCIGSNVGRIFHLDKKEEHFIILCGMSAVFSALFGTPLTATVFAIEFIDVGTICYAAFIPCLTASLVAYKIALLFGIKPVFFALDSIPDASLFVILRVILLAGAVALVSILFCLVLQRTAYYAHKWIPNEYTRILCGGVCVILLTLLVRNTAYNGAGMDIVANAIAGTAFPLAFLLKIIFTAVTLGTGFKGGEIVPTFFIGATLGCTVGALLHLDAGFGAAIGLVAMFCGVSNSPLTSIFLSIEIFGSKGLLLFAIASGVSFVLSGNSSLYLSQKIVSPKL